MKIILLNGFFVAFILLASCFSLRAQETQLAIASYNIRYDNPKDAPDTWDKRHPVIINMVKFYEMDIFGIQEGMHHQVTDLAEGLPNFGYLGVGRDDGAEKGEYTAIFYNKEKFKELESDTFWLSEDTTKPNKGWDANLSRICTWAKFEALETGEQFLALSIINYILINMMDAMFGINHSPFQGYCFCLRTYIIGLHPKASYQGFWNSKIKNQLG